MGETSDMRESSDHKQVVKPHPSPLEPHKPDVQRWSSDQLFGQANEAHIQHGGEVYRLLRTRNDKLILVK